ncbi:MAG TPA: NAD/FAD-binding protein, partial [Thermoanaerobaculia bacterium]|nr:NAD/FAD-binding protein [Thermoanaerobaculia bacterium]
NVAVTYYLNRLQALSEPTDYLVTLNPERRIAEESILRRMTYTHPVYTLDSLDTQAELPSLNGKRATYYCGAYFGYGFHEDGLKSGIAVAERLGVPFP